VPPAGTLQFDSASYSVDENGSSATITVIRSGGSFGEATVNYSTGDGTATAGVDYSVSSGTLVFADGETSNSFTVPVIDDNAYEGEETVALSLSQPTGATIGQTSSATLTIRDNDSAPSSGTLQYNTATYSVNENSATATITVTRTNGSFGDIAVDYATGDGTATAGLDYTVSNGTLNFADGVASQSFTVPILDDTDYEGNETVNLTLSNAVGGASLGSNTAAVLTIVENDAPPSAGVLQFNAAAYNVSEETGNVLITVVSNGGVTGEVTVDVATGDDTASAGSDYTSVQDTLVFGDGVTDRSFDVPILDDANYEGIETFNINLINATGGATLGGTVKTEVTIMDNDPPPLAGALQFSGNVYRVAEDGNNAVITVTRVGGSFGQVTVDYSSSDDTALAPDDYEVTTGTLQFMDGQVSESFLVPIVDDAVFESDETVHLNLNNPTGDASLGTPNNAVLTIMENDPPPSAGVLQFSGPGYAVSEAGAEALITVTRTGGSNGLVSVDFATGDGSAVGGNDYQTTGGTLMFDNGVVSRSFTVGIIDDDVGEDDETVELTLRNETGGAALAGVVSAVLTINDNDTALKPNNPGTTSTNQTNDKRCFIATAAYGSYLEPEVKTLREFRDNVLMPYNWGKQAVAFYYRTSPPVANFIAGHELARSVVRWLLSLVVYTIKYPSLLILLPGLLLLVRRIKASRGVSPALKQIHP
jgi:hypothetical protein